MNPKSIRNAALLLAPLVWSQAACAHGIAGNRYFDGTMTFDDPAVADEAIVPYWANSQYPTQGSVVAENRINWAFARLLTPTLAITMDSGWLYQNFPVGRTSGFDKTNIGLKYEAYRNNQREAAIQEFFAQGQIVPLTVTYEDFVSKYEETVFDILRWLGLDTAMATVAPPAYEQLSDAVSEDWVQRFRRDKQARWTNRVCNFHWPHTHPRFDRR